MRVVGAGFGRTGTLSLKAALERLGFGPCYHMTEVFENPEHADFWRAAWRGEPVDWGGTLGGYKASVDWLACAFYAELMQRNPDAKVVLSVRDPESWYESVRNTIYEISVVIPRSRLSQPAFALMGLFFDMSARVNMAEEIIWNGTFDGRFEDKPYATRVFERHTEEVKRSVPQDRLLVYEVKEGWGPLCEFLGVEEPDEPFPRLNDTAEFRRRIQAIRALSFAAPAALTLLVATLLYIYGRRKS